MSKPATILVVDDNPTNVLILARAMQKQGYTVVEAQSGDSAVQIARERQPDLIVLDVMMPDCDGLDVCRELKATEPTASIPVIFVTARTEIDQVVQAFEAGASDYVTKPFRAAEILARVSVHMRLRETERELTRRSRQEGELALRLAEANEQLVKLNRTDLLTQLLDRGAWEDSAGAEHRRARRNESAYAVLMIDVDLFKRFDDSLGHQAGDDCLRRVARCIACTCRATDIVGRYGGEEFVVMAPETDLAAAIRLGERIRQAVVEMDIHHPTSDVADYVTVSIGAACSGRESWEYVLKEADVALYRAKQSGRNATCSAAQDERTTAPIRGDASVEDGANNRPARVLAVDCKCDDEAPLQDLLARQGYEVLVADDVKKAVGLARHDGPDVILLDSRLPGMGSFHAARMLKSDPDTQHIPIIMVCAADESSEVVAGIHAGADEFLTRPIHNTELALRVWSMLRFQREYNDRLRNFRLRGEQTRLLKILLEFCRALGTTTTLEQTLTHTVATAAEVSACMRVAVLLPGASGDCLRVEQSRGIAASGAGATTFSLRRSASGQAYRTRQTVVVNDPKDWKWEERVEDAELLGEAPFVAAPLSTSGRVAGVLTLSGRRERKAFEPRELEYIDLIASFAGAAIYSIQSLAAAHKAQESIVVALAKLAEHRDDDTGRHVDRVTQYSLLLANELRSGGSQADEIDDDFLYELARAVPLHDIGKVAIPDRIMLKAGPLTRDELVVMRSHARIGADTIRSVIERVPEAGFLEMAEQIARSHHERMDGSGYPDGLRGSEIPLAARIVALADVYDALTTERVYKEMMTHEEAVEIITGRSTGQFDELVVQAFVAHEETFARMAQAMRDDPDYPPRRARLADGTGGRVRELAPEAAGEPAGQDAGGAGPTLADERKCAAVINSTLFPLLVTAIEDAAMRQGCASVARAAREIAMQAASTIDVGALTNQLDGLASLEIAPLVADACVRGVDRPA